MRQFRLHDRVYFSDTDAGGIAYHRSYFDWAEHGRTEMLREMVPDKSQSELAEGENGILILVRSIKRSGVLYDAMEARCYDGELKVLSEERPAEKKEILCIAGYEAVLLGMVIWSWIR